MKHEDFLARYSNSLPDGSRRNLTALARAFLVWAGSRPLWIDVPGPGDTVERVASAELIRGYEKHLTIGVFDKEKKERVDTYSPGTISKNWAVIRRMYIVNKVEWPFRRGDAPIIPEKDIHDPAMSPDQIEEMIDVSLGLKPSIEFNPQPKHVACLILSTIWGLRREEIKDVNANIIDTKLRDGYGTIYIETAKHGRQRYHLIPPYLIKPLTDYGFHHQRSLDYFSAIFTDLKIMCGYIGATIPKPISDLAYGVGWHAIRRGLVKELEATDLKDTQIDQFLRWKVSGQGMRARYARSKTVIMGKEGEDNIATIGSEDRALDLKVYEVHPFLKMWRERLT